MILDGNALAEKILKELKLKTIHDGQPLQLAAIVIGEDEGIKKFVRLKKKMAEFAGLVFSSYEFSGQASQEEVLKTIKYLNNDSDVHGIFVELPILAQFDQDSILNAVTPSKDADVLSETMQKRFYSNTSPILPPAVGALKLALTEGAVSVKDKSVAVVGHGFLVGKPIAHWLTQEGARVSIVDVDTKKPEVIIRTADIVVAGAGKPGLITADMIKDQAAVIDFGYSLRKGKAVGDVAFDEVAKKASFITPVPGGVGPLVIAAVLQNVILLSEK